MSLPRYPKYKDSRVAWLGEVPEHWEIFKSRRLFYQRKDKAVQSDKQLTASQKYGIVYQSDYIEMEGQKVVQVITGVDILKHVEPNDFVISMRSFQGGIEWSGLCGSISSAYVMLKPCPKIQVNYFKYLFKSNLYIQALQTTTNLVRDGQALRYENFTLVDLPLPNNTEQTAIADFLDRETNKIDLLLAEQETLIALLDEKINALVLSAINDRDTVNLRLADAVDVISRPVLQVEGVEYKPLGLFNRGRGVFHKEHREKSDMGESDFYWVKAGDLIISGQFAWEGAVAMAYEDEDGCVVSHRYPVLRGNELIAVTEYIFALLRTKHGDFLLNECSTGAAGRNKPLNLRLLLKEKIPLPNIQRQQLIAKLVKERQKVMKETRSLSMHLKERRSALVSAAVTGKIDVRPAA